MRKLVSPMLIKKIMMMMVRLKKKTATITVLLLMKMNRKTEILMTLMLHM